MGIVLPLAGMALALLIIVRREQIGNMLGEPAWMHGHGGIYTWIVVIALIIFFWSLAELSGTTTYLFSPLKNFLPGNETVPPNVAW